MKKILIAMTGLLAATLLTTGCGSNSRRGEIEQRKAALAHKQDSTLKASQAELAIIDSALEATKAEYEAMSKVVEQHRQALRATEEELTALTLLRMKRDSLQVQWNMLGAKIKYIRREQAKLQQ